MNNTMRYSTQEEIDAFADKLTSDATAKSRPMLVLDMDANFAIGYNLKSGVTLPLKEGDNPESQAIPFGSDVQQLLADGKVEPAIFAVKAMDVRIHPDVARLMNKNIADTAHPERKFDIVVLSSRDSGDLLRILKESGIEHPEKLTLVGDSGANIFVNGEKRNVRPLSKQEQGFLNGIDTKVAGLEAEINKVLIQQGYDPKDRPALFIEPKGIAKNVDWRGILAYYGYADGSELDEAIATAVRASMEGYIANGPQEDGKPVFKLLDSDAAVEIKMGSVDKGKALRAIVKAAQTEGYTPSSVVFSGDDVSKLVDGKGSPGTDQAAFLEVPKLQQETGIPFYTMHTQHPASGELGEENPVPSPGKAAANMGITPDIIVPDPLANVEVVVNITERARKQAAEQSGAKSWRGAVASESAGQESKRAR